MVDIKIGILGIGAAGSNIAEKLSTKDEDSAQYCAALNTSIEDLSSLKMIPAKNRWEFGEIGGAGKNRQLVFKELPKQFDRIRSRVSEVFDQPIVGKGGKESGIDIVFVAFSGGGGTGSGAGPAITKALAVAFKHIKFGCIVMLPSEKESLIAHANAVSCIRELADANFPILVVDNSKFDHLDADHSIMQKYDMINESTVNNLLSFCKFKKTSPWGNIDVTDRLTLLSDAGVMIIASNEVKDTDENPLATSVRQALNSSPLIADVNTSAKRVALQFECQSTLLTGKNIGQLGLVFKNAIGRFEGFYSEETSEDGSKILNRVLVAMSGMKISEKWISERLSLIESLKTVEDKTIDKSLFNNKETNRVRDDWAVDVKKKAHTVVEAEDAENAISSIFGETTKLYNQ